MDKENGCTRNPSNQRRCLWAAPFDAIAAVWSGVISQHAERRRQRDRLIKKYGSDLKDVKIITRKDDLMFCCKQADQATGEYVKYAYFDSLAACNSYQEQVLNVPSSRTANS